MNIEQIAIHLAKMKKGLLKYNACVYISVYMCMYVFFNTY